MRTCGDTKKHFSHLNNQNHLVELGENLSLMGSSVGFIFEKFNGLITEINFYSEFTLQVVLISYVNVMLNQSKTNKVVTICLLILPPPLSQLIPPH